MFNLNADTYTLRIFDYGEELIANNIADRKNIPFFSIVQAYRGNYIVSINGSEMTETGEGGFFIGPADVDQVILHKARPGEKEMRSRWVFFGLYLNGVIDITKHIDYPVVIKGDKAKPLSDAFDELLKIPSDSEYIVHCLKKNEICYFLLHEILKSSVLTLKQNQYSNILPALSYIEQHINEKIQSEVLAKQCNLSVSQFFNVFKNITGLTPFSYINKSRLKRATQLIASGKFKMSEISQMTGYCDQFHLSREFKKEYGISPSKYKKNFSVKLKLEDEG